MAISCPNCSHPVRADARFCDACGASLPADENARTMTSPPRVSVTRRDDPRFLPGAVLDRRYRIVAPLGRGGMGEVYPADDIKLGQPVALKLLPRSLEQDAARLALLLDEVKLARQVSHPNVCRVWDAGETEGLHFVAMEYVDGEDLGSLLRRIGRIPEERGVQIAREICAGLAAIHDQGVLHRDLKPSNVMLDGRGRVRITDWLATRPCGRGRRSRPGIPAYGAGAARRARRHRAQRHLLARPPALRTVHRAPRVRVGSHSFTA
jgi:serine/threonine-protein kinase